MKLTTPAPADTVNALYEGHHGWLLSWLRRRLHCPQNAADVAQDTFVRVLCAGPYVAPREPRAFLATVARRLLIDNSRRKRLEKAYLDELEQWTCHLDQAPSPEQIIEAVRVLEGIDRALSRMAPRVREAFMLRHLEGLNQNMIAARLGVSLRTVQLDLVLALEACDDAAGAQA